MSATQKLPNFQSFVDLLSYRAQLQPSDLAYRFYHEGLQSDSLNYGDLFLHAKAIAAQSSKEANLGDRVILIYPPGLQLIKAFYGAQCAGFVPILMYPPSNQSLIKKMFNMMKNAQPTLIFTAAEYAESLTDLMKQYKHATDEKLKIAKIKIIVTENIDLAASKSWTKPVLELTSLAFLQYSSGSTGDPKGVMVTHGNLLDNTHIIAQIAWTNAIETIISWLPPYHDMGLIGTLLMPLYAGLPSITMSPITFLRHPNTWLALISTYPNVLSGGPNFAYEYCTHKISDEELAQYDLSRWKVAFNGAETVQLDTLEHFYERFKQVGFKKNVFYPCYGLAEATLVVSIKASHQPINWVDVSRAKLKEGVIHLDSELTAENKQHIVSSGELLQTVVIVDPHSHQKLDHQLVGEIWVRGKSVAMGYYNQPEKNQHTFHAHLKDDPSKESYLRTGDLGFIENSHLFVTGRIKDIIILHGLNHYPHDIERTVAKCSHDLVRGHIIAFSVSNSNEEALAIIAGIKKPLEENQYVDISKRILEKIDAEHQVSPHLIVFVLKETILKTTSGKLRHSACKELFEQNKLDVLYQYKLTNKHSEINSVLTKNTDNRDSLQAWIINWIAEYCKKPSSDISSTTPFSYYGIDSITINKFAVDIENTFGISLNPIVLFEHGTPVKLASYISKQYSLPKNMSFSSPSSGMNEIQQHEHRPTPIRYHQLNTEKISLVYPLFKQFRAEKIIGLTATPIKNKPNYFIIPEIKNTPILAFISCSYLGLEWDPRLHQAAINAIQEAGTQLSCSRAFVSVSYYQELENLLQEIYGVKPIITETTTLGHLSAMPTLIDHQDAIILDEQVHNSVQMAAKICAVNGTEITKVPHSSMTALDAAISQYTKMGKKRIWYCADGLYSMHGDFTPMPELLQLLQKYPQFNCYIDDAHSLGWLGEHGAGYVASFNKLPGFERVVMSGSLAKGFASLGGLIITTNEEWRDRIATCGETMIFSGPIQPPLLAASIATAKILLSNEFLMMQAELKRKIQFFYQLIKKNNLDLLSSGHAPIFYVRIGEINKVSQICKFLQKRNFYVSPTGFPAVLPNQAGLRITLNRLHSESEMLSLVDAIVKATCATEKL